MTPSDTQTVLAHQLIVQDDMADQAEIPSMALASLMELSVKNVCT